MKLQNSGQERYQEAGRVIRYKEECGYYDSERQKYWQPHPRDPNTQSMPKTKTGPKQQKNPAPIMSLTLGNKQSLLLGESKYVDKQPSCGTGMQRWLKLDNGTLTLRITLQHLVPTLSTRQQEQFLENVKPMVHWR